MRGRAFFVSAALSGVLALSPLCAFAQDASSGEVETPVPAQTAVPGTPVPFTPIPSTPEPVLSEQPPTPTPQKTPLPLPEIGKIYLDAKQEDPSRASVHIAVTRAQEDGRKLELIVLLVRDDEIESIGAYQKKYPLEEDAFDEKNLLLIDEKDKDKRYAALIPYETRYIIAGRVSGEVFYAGIYDAIPRPDPTATPDGGATPTPYKTNTPAPEQTPAPDMTPEPEPSDEPSLEPEPDPMTPDEMEEFEETMPTVSNVLYINPKDEDMDGFYSRTEYRLGLDPALRDSTGTGYWDFVSIYMRGRLQMDGVTTALDLNDPETLEGCVKAGLLEAGVGEENPAQATRDMQGGWEKSGAAQIGWMDKENTRLLCLNNRGVFIGNYQKSENFDVERALSMEKIGYPSMNKYQFSRVFDATGDGALALLYDRECAGKDDEIEDTGKLRADAVLIDTVNMRAYKLPGTKGARGIALSLDGSVLAVWKQEELAIWKLGTGEVLRIEDEKRLSRVEMLAFTPDNRLVVRVTQMGYNAFDADGVSSLGGMEELGIFVRSRDSLGMSVYDKDHLLLRVNAQLYLSRTGIYVTGEDGKSWRNFSPKYFRQCAAETKAQ